MRRESARGSALEGGLKACIVRSARRSFPLPPHPLTHLVTFCTVQVTAVLGQLAGPDGSPNDSAVGEVEDSLCRLEDCALLMTRHADCLLHCADVTVRERGREVGGEVGNKLLVACGGAAWGGGGVGVTGTGPAQGRALPGALRGRDGEGRGMGGGGLTTERQSQ